MEQNLINSQYKQYINGAKDLAGMAPMGMPTVLKRSFNMPLDADFVFNTYTELVEACNNTTWLSKAQIAEKKKAGTLASGITDATVGTPYNDHLPYPGLICSVIHDTTSLNNGIYFVRTLDNGRMYIDKAATTDQMQDLLHNSAYSSVGRFYYSGKTWDDGWKPNTTYSEVFNDYANNVSTGAYSHVEGGANYSGINAAYSHVEGHGNTAYGLASHAEGWSTTADGNCSHAEGSETKAREYGSHAEGYFTTASGQESHAEGAWSAAYGEESHAEGYRTTASGQESHAEGDSTTASGQTSHAEGGSTTASGGYSHAEGRFTTASGSSSHAEGYFTTASGQESHAEGRFTTASGQESHAEGYFTTASGNQSHAEGNNTIASESNSHAEGYRTTASGQESHAEGDSTTASGYRSHAEGYNSYATGNYSHSQNFYTYAGGKASTAIGYNSYAMSAYSFTSGTYTISSHNEAEFSIGRYNVSYADSLFNIGIGTSNTDRKNAVDVRTSGVAYFHKSAYIYDPIINQESQIVSMAYLEMSYNATYNLIKDKTNGLPPSVKSIDSFESTYKDKNVLHYTTQSFDGSKTWNTNANNTVVMPIANNANGDNPRRTDFATGATATAGLMSAMDKARLDDIWTGDKQIVPISIKTGTWTVYKNDGTTTYTLANIKNQSNSISSCAVEYGFKVKWSGTWQYSNACGANDNYKAGDSTSGTFGTTLPSSTAAGSTGTTFTSGILGPNAGNIATQKIVAAKKGLVIAEFPTSVSVGNPSHSGRIVPATGNDETSTSVNWGTYRLYFYGQVDTLNPTMDMMTKLTVGGGQPNGKGWTIQYTADSTHAFAIAYPSVWGKISTIKKNGVEIITTSFLYVGEFDYTNGAGYTQKYYIYRSGMGAANMSITVN